MQILHTPTSTADNNIKVTMSGITILKQGKYRKRHSGTKEMIESYNNEILTPVEYKERYKGKEPAVKAKKKVDESIEQVVKIPRKKCLYSINKKEVTHRIKNFVNQIQGEKKLYFWTITFPQGTTDDTAFLCFNKWLTRVRKELNLRSYLWITERQDGKRLQDDSKTATDTIHFHITLHQRLCVRKANKFMRACLFTCIDQGLISYNRQDAIKYNGVDISKDRKTKRVINFAEKKRAKSLTNYLTKYVSKNKGAFKHLAWHSSRDYSNLVTGITFSTIEFSKGNGLNTIESTPLFDTEWFQFFKYKGEPPEDVLKYLAFINHIIVTKINSQYSKN